MQKPNLTQDKIDQAIKRLLNPTRNNYVLEVHASQDSNAYETILVITETAYANWLEHQNQSVKDWLLSSGFKATGGKLTSYPQASQNGFIKRYLLVVNPNQAMWDFASAFDALPIGRYQLESVPANADFEIPYTEAALGWILASYQFDQFMGKNLEHKDYPILLLPNDFSLQETYAIAEAMTMGRDMINFPASHLNPDSFGHIARELAHQYSATLHQIIGEDLCNQNFPLIHAVGKGSSFEPRLIDLRWKPKSQDGKNDTLLKITLVGKGVTFDSGGLDIKSPSNMKMMKKDMGGAASALSLAKMIMALALPIELRVLIPAVENMISGNAYRPLDILISRLGTSIEVGDTDAEGRLILADALCLACESPIDLLIDFATLTGAARVALGTDLPAIFTHDKALAADMMRIGEMVGDPCWQLPLHAPYRTQVKGKSAQLTNAPTGGYGGAITAALFLDHFVKEGVKWVHIDMMGWNLTSQPARPEGGEAHMARMLFALIKTMVKG